MRENNFTDYTGSTLSNRYRLDKIVGIGGMAVVYKGYDLIDNKDVAVKIVRDEFLDDESFRTRFRTESIAIASLRHPNIVKVYDVSLGDKLEYIVMEYVDGVTLKQYLRQHGALSWQQALEITKQILSALAQAHSKNIIHRDIKPGNIMLLKDNKTVKVTDFGIALVGRQQQANRNDNYGSVRYTSPEQARANAGKIDNRTDIYSVGIMLYEMTTGRLPFDSDSDMSVLLMQIQTPPTPPRVYNKNIPAGVEQIIMHAIEKLPSRRFSTAQEMMLDIEEFLRNPSLSFDYSHQTEEQIPPRATDSKRIVIKSEQGNSQPVRKKDQKKKNRAVPVMIGVIALIIVLIIGVIWYFVARTKEVEIPDFVGKMYNDILEDSEYKYFFDNDMIEANYVYTADYEEGRVISQSISPGTKIEVTMSSGEIIRLNVAYAGSTMAVPEILKNEPLKDVRSRLSKLGFVVKTEGVVDTSVEEGRVISVDPAPGTQLAYGATVTIYYAISDSSRKAMPNMIDRKEDAAVNELESMGFTVTVEHRASPAAKNGLVLEQSIAADTPVDPAITEVTLTVGRTDTTYRTTDLTVELPDIGNDERQSVYLYIDGERYDSREGVRLNGGSVTLSVGGSGVRTFAVYLGSQLYTEGTIDFSRSAPYVNSSGNYEYNADQTTAAETTTSAGSVSAVAIPDLIGKTYQEAVDALQAAGFGTPNVIYEMSETGEEGTVIRVDSDSTYFTPDAAASSTVTIVISAGN